MYGWRVRIGHVAPSRGDTLVYEFYQMMPAGFMILNSTGTIRQLVDADLERQLQRIEEAAADLVDNKCDSVIIGGSPLFTKLGYGSDTEMGKRLSDKYGVPVSPGITGEIEALKSLNLKKLVVATPRVRSHYTEEAWNAAVAQIPMGRTGTPEEIASAVLFLATDENKYITGQTIHVNGAWLNW